MTAEIKHTRFLLSHALSWHTYAYTHTANEGPVRIQYKCLVPIYVIPEMKLRGLIISKTELHIHVSVSDWYIPRIGLPIMLQPK